MRNVDRKGGKMETRWTGPYKITAYLGKGRFRLLNEETGKHLANSINSSRLKKYITRKLKKFRLENKEKMHQKKVYTNIIYSERERERNRVKLRSQIHVIYVFITSISFY